MRCGIEQLAGVGNAAGWAWAKCRTNGDGELARGFRGAAALVPSSKGLASTSISSLVSRTFFGRGEKITKNRNWGFPYSVFAEGWWHKEIVVCDFWVMSKLLVKATVKPGLEIWYECKLGPGNCLGTCLILSSEIVLLRSPELPKCLKTNVCWRQATSPNLCFSQPRMKPGPGNKLSVSRKSCFEYFISFATSLFADLHQASYCAATEKLLLYVRAHRSLGGVSAQPGVSLFCLRMNVSLKTSSCGFAGVCDRDQPRWRGCSAPRDRGHCCRGTLAAFPPMQLNYLFPGGQRRSLYFIHIIQTFSVSAWNELLFILET